MFGFTVYNSVKRAGNIGRTPFPSPRDKIEGGYAVASLGYDDKMKVKNKCSGDETAGALLIRNSREKIGEKRPKAGVRMKIL